MSDQYTLSKTYDPAQIEGDIYQGWLESGAFHAKPDKRDKSYVIMMPLPNVTGALHMGHAMDNVMQDLLIRWHRMLDDNTLWMPGTDHAGIATQAVVEKRLKEIDGLTRHEVGREGLVQRIWQWKDQFQTRIVSQQQRMGCSADWQRQRFTMDAVCARAVRHTFMSMFRDGLIFRGTRLVNWDPYLQTSISDDEVYHKSIQGHFWHLCYPIENPAANDPKQVVVATTRPETMLGDTAVAVHPDPEAALQTELNKLKSQLDKAAKKELTPLKREIEQIEKRQQTMLASLLHLRDMAASGKRVTLPLMNRSIPLILDEWAKPHLGSGCVKITPAHDPNDYEVWQRHADSIDIINILNPDGTLNQNAGAYAGLDRFAARKKVITDLESCGLLQEVEDRLIEIGHSDRSKTPIEPYLSDQWFVYMGDRKEGVVMGRGTQNEHQSPGLVQSAIDAVRENRVRFHPQRFVKTYLDWLEEKRDWPISRQLWWGHRIPVWSKSVALDQLGQTVEECNKLLGDLDQKQWCLRIVHKERGISVLSDQLDQMRSVLDQNDLCLLDLCLLEDHVDTIARLKQLGFAQDPDVLDTWYSSALWPHSTLGWPDPKTAEVGDSAKLTNQGRDCLETYYPGSCLVTGRDIITLWVARMVLAGEYNLGLVPFSDVFIHANILDGKGERMSKSKGNGIDPVDIIDTYGTDAMRYVLCDMQTGNQDIRLPVTAICPHCQKHQDLAKLKHGSSVFTYLCASCSNEFDVLGTMPEIPAAKLISERFLDGAKFCNKLWNTARFALANLQQDQVTNQTIEQADLKLEDRWILAAMNQAMRQVQMGLQAYSPSQAIGAARDFMWGELCDWYLELIKPRLAQPESRSAQVAMRVLAYCLDQTLRLLHPFVPFITEYLYQKLNQQVPVRDLPKMATQQTSALLIAAAWPTPQTAYDDQSLLDTFSDLQAAISGIREVRSSKGLAPAITVEVTLRPLEERAQEIRAQSHIVERMANVKKLHVDPQAEQPKGSASLVVGQLQIFVHDMLDPGEERKRLEKERKKIEKEIQICAKKLSNKGFLAKAPEHVVEEQRARQSKYENQRDAIDRSLAALAD